MKMADSTPEQTAPELLEALRRAREILTVPAAEYVPAIPDAWRVIDAAIAKAEGRS